MSKSVLCLLILFHATVLVGCGNENGVYPVRGKVVSSTGIAPTFGTVEFRSTTNGRIASGAIQHDGSFSLTTLKPNDGAVVGEHDVILVRFINVEDGPIHTHGHAVEIPERYADYKTSGLTAVVQPIDRNEITIQFDAE